MRSHFKTDQILTIFSYTRKPRRFAGSIMQVIDIIEILSISLILKKLLIVHLPILNRFRQY